MSHAAPRRGARRSCPSVALCLFRSPGDSACPACSPPRRRHRPPFFSRPPTALPVRRVVLYKSGVGYFEHLGQVRGNQTVTIDFTSGQLDDVLKSLTTLDLDGGRMSNVNYNSDAALERRLAALRLPSASRRRARSFLRRCAARA